MSADWCDISVTSFVKLSTLLVKKGSHEKYVTVAFLAVVWTLRSYKILIDIIWADVLSKNKTAAVWRLVGYYSS